MEPEGSAYKILAAMPQEITWETKVKTGAWPWNCSYRSTSLFNDVLCTV